MSILAVVSKQTRVLQWRSLTVDLDQRTVFASGTKVEASPAEFAVLRLLLCNRNVAMAKGGILQSVFGVDHGRDERQADVYVARLNRSLGSVGLVERIAVIPGRGYAILDETSDTDAMGRLQPGVGEVLVAA